MHKPTPTRERFWSKVHKTDNCWLWTASTIHFGYGGIHDQGRTRHAHRVSWEMANGPVPDGLCVLHRCDNPPCVRPDHLFLGTIQDNNRDRDQKGRLVSVRGERHYRAKLTQSAVDVIRASDASMSELSRRYGVSRTSVRRARTGQSWRVMHQEQP